MARINTYPKISGAPADSDVFIIDSTSGSAGTRTILWSVMKTVLSGIFASKQVVDGNSHIDGLMRWRDKQIVDFMYNHYLERVSIVDHNGTPALFFTNGADGGSQNNIYLDAADVNRSGIMARDEWRFLHTLKTVDQITTLPKGSDLNEVRTPGYYSILWKNIDEIHNMPIPNLTTAIVVVYQHVPSSEYTQIFFKSLDLDDTHGRHSVYMRYFDNQGHWHNWYDITSYSNATQQSDGLMSAADKRKLDTISNSSTGPVQSMSNAYIDSLFRI